MNENKKPEENKSFPVHSIFNFFVFSLMLFNGIFKGKLTYDKVSIVNFYEMKFNVFVIKIDCFYRNRIHNEIKKDDNINCIFA